MFKSIKNALELLKTAQFDPDPFEKEPIKEVEPIIDEPAVVDDNVATTDDEAKEVGEKCGVNWEEVAFEPADLAKGIDVEYEHGSVNEQTNITNDDLEMTAKIAIAHLNEGSNYYELLAELESNLSDGEEKPEAEEKLEEIEAKGSLRKKSQNWKNTYGAEEFERMVKEGVFFVDGEGSVTVGDKYPVHVAIVVDIQSIGPHKGVIFVDQNRFHASGDFSLQEAFSILQQHELDNADPKYLKELQDEWGDEWIEIMTETYDGMVFQMNAEEFARVYDSNKGIFDKTSISVSREEPEEEIGEEVEGSAVR